MLTDTNDLPLLSKHAPWHKRTQMTLDLLRNNVWCDNTPLKQSNKCDKKPKGSTDYPDWNRSELCEASMDASGGCCCHGRFYFVWIWLCFVCQSRSTWILGPVFPLVDRLRNLRHCGRFHTWTVLIWYTSTQMTSSESICILPSGRFVVTLHDCKAGQSTNPRRAFLTPTNEREGLNALSNGWNRIQNANVKVQDHAVHTDCLLVPVTRQNISKLFVSCCLVTCVLTASQLLQGYNGIEPRAPLLGDFNSVVLFCISMCLLHSYMCEWAKPLEQLFQMIQVWKHPPSPPQLEHKCILWRKCQNSNNQMKWRKR